MPRYHFETREFGISDEGIHLLRSGFNYKTYLYSDVSSMSVEEGKIIKNWIGILVIGLALIAIAFSYWGWIVQGPFKPQGFHARAVAYSYILPVLPLMIGAYCVYNAMRTGTVIRIKVNNTKTDSLPLTELENSGKMTAFQKFLEARQRK